MYRVEERYQNKPEFLASERYQNVSCTVSDEGVSPETNGKKYVPGGTLLDGEGKALKITRSGSAGAYTYALSGDPAGILFHTIEVTHGAQPGACLIDGSVNAERLEGTYVVEALPQIRVKLTYIKFFVDGKLQVGSK